MNDTRDLVYILIYHWNPPCFLFCYFASILLQTSPLPCSRALLIYRPGVLLLTWRVCNLLLPDTLVNAKSGIPQVWVGQTIDGPWMGIVYFGWLLTFPYKSRRKLLLSLCFSDTLKPVNLLFTKREDLILLEVYRAG